MNTINSVSDLYEAGRIIFHDQEELAEACAETGELTPEAEAQEERLEAMKYAVEHDGADMIGRRMKEAEDKMKTIKAEKDHSARMVKSMQRLIDYYKFLMSETMRLIGKDKVKGSHYSFTAYTSEHTTVNMDELNERWLGAVDAAARTIGLPDYIDIELKTNVTKIQEWAQTHDGQGLAYIDTETATAIRFTKPRASKEDK